MSRYTCLLLITFFTLLCLGAAAAVAGKAPSLHENPAGMTAQQPFDVNGRLMLQLENMFSSLEDVSSGIGGGDYNASRRAFDRFDQYFGLFQNTLGTDQFVGVGKPADPEPDQ